jgi:GT2 family glycosyltransferase
MTAVPISIAITTHNRVGDLSTTLRALQAFEGEFSEIMVCADGCTDGTQAFLAEHFPSARLFENNPGKGSIPSRNRMIREAKTPFVLLLDDDSYPIESHFAREVHHTLEIYPDIGVLTFPQRSDEFPDSLQCKEFGPNRRVGTFTSSGAVIRRDLFLELGGFPEMFFHAYEEPDYSLRVLGAGYQVVQWNRLTIRHHFTSVMRDEGRTHRRHARNELWSTLMRAPMPLLLLLIPYRILSQLRYAWKRGLGWVIREPFWWWAALRGIFSALGARRPVSREDYRNWLRLMRNPQPFAAEE